MRSDGVAVDFTTCIHCGLCRFVCEDKVKPHNMGLWVRRSIGMDRLYTGLGTLTPTARGEKEEREWEYLQKGGPDEMLERARVFRKQGAIPE